MKKQKLTITWIFVAIFTATILLFHSDLKPLIDSPTNTSSNSYALETQKIYKNNNIIKTDAKASRTNISVSGYASEEVSTKRFYRNDGIITTGTNTNPGMEILGIIDKIQFFGLPTYEDTDATNKKFQSFGIEKILIKNINNVWKNTLSLETIYANGDKNINNNHSFTSEYNENKYAHDNFNTGIISSKNVKDYTHISLGLKNDEQKPVKDISLKLPAAYNKTLNRLNNDKIGWDNFTSSIGSIYVQSGEKIYRSQSNINIKQFLDSSTNTINLGKAPIKWSLYSVFGNDNNAFITMPKATNQQTNFVYTTQAQPEKVYSIPTPLMDYVVKYKEVDNDNIYDARKWESLLIDPENIRPDNYLDFALVTRNQELIKVITQISDSNAPKTINNDLFRFISKSRDRFAIEEDGNSDKRIYSNEAIREYKIKSTGKLSIKLEGINNFVKNSAHPIVNPSWVEVSKMAGENFTWAFDIDNIFDAKYTPGTKLKEEIFKNKSMNKEHIKISAWIMEKNDATGEIKIKIKVSLLNLWGGEDVIRIDSVQISDPKMPITNTANDLIDFIDTFNKEEFFNNIIYNQRSLSIGFANKTKDTTAVSFASLRFLKFVSWKDGINLNRINLYIKNDFIRGEISDEYLKTLIEPQFNTKSLYALNMINGIEHLFFQFNKSSDYLPLTIFGNVSDIKIKAYKLKTFDISTFDELQTIEQWKKVFVSENPTWINGTMKNFGLIIPKKIGPNNTFIRDFKFQEDLSVNDYRYQLLKFIKTVDITVPTIPEIKFNTKTRWYDVSSIKVDGTVIEANVINGVLRYDFRSENVSSKDIAWGNTDMTEFYTTNFTQQEAENKGLIKVQGIETKDQESSNVTSIYDPIDYSNISSKEEIKIDGQKYGSVIANGHVVWNYDLAKIKYYTNNKGEIEYFTSIAKLIRKVGPGILRNVSSTTVKVIKNNIKRNEVYRTEWEEWKKKFINYKIPNPSTGVDVPYLIIDGKTFDRKFFSDGKEVWDWKSITYADISKIKYVWIEDIGNNQVVPHLFTSYKKPIQTTGKIRPKINTFYQEIIIHNKETPIKYIPWIKHKGEMTKDQVVAELNKQNTIDGNKIDWLIKDGVFMFKEYKDIKYIVEYLDIKKGGYQIAFFTSLREVRQFKKANQTKNIKFTLKNIVINSNEEQEVKIFCDSMVIEPSSEYQEITLDGKRYPIKFYGGMMYYDINENLPIQYKYKGEYYSSIEKIFKIIATNLKIDIKNVKIDIKELSTASYKKPDLGSMPFVGKKIFDKNLLEQDVLKQNVALIKKGVLIDGIKHSFDIYNGKLVSFKELENIKYFVFDSDTKEFKYYTSYSVIPQKYKAINLLSYNNSIYSIDVNISKFHKMTTKDHWVILGNPKNNKDIIIKKEVNGVARIKPIKISKYKDPVTGKSILALSDYNSVKEIKFFDGEKYFMDIETAFKFSTHFDKLTKVSVQVTTPNVPKESKTDAEIVQFKILIYPISLIVTIFVVLFLIRIIAFINNRINRLH